MRNVNLPTCIKTRDFFVFVVDNTPLRCIINVVLGILLSIILGIEFENNYMSETIGAYLAEAKYAVTEGK